MARPIAEYKPLFLTADQLSTVREFIRGKPRYRVSYFDCPQCDSGMKTRSHLQWFIKDTFGIVMDGRVCLSCGWYHKRREISSKPLREAVYTLDNRECVYCASTDDLSLDHILPQYRGGQQTIENLVTACRRCNSSKLNRTDNRDMHFGRFRNIPAETKD